MEGYQYQSPYSSYVPGSFEGKIRSFNKDAQKVKSLENMLANWRRQETYLHFGLALSDSGSLRSTKTNHGTDH